MGKLGYPFHSNAGASSPTCAKVVEVKFDHGPGWGDTSGRKKKKAQVLRNCTKIPVFGRSVLLCSRLLLRVRATAQSGNSLFSSAVSGQTSVQVALSMSAKYLSFMRCTSVDFAVQPELKVDPRAG